MISTDMILGLFSCLILGCLGQTYMTQYDQHFQFPCPRGQILSSLESVHSGHYEDRVFNFHCAAPPKGAGLGSCHWGEYANEYDGLLNYQCPGEGVIAGVESTHSNKYEDRIYKFYCCQLSGFVSHGCQYTAYANLYDHQLTYHVPANMVIKGVTSTHSGKYEDRIFKFEVCAIDKISG